MPDITDIIPGVTTAKDAAKMYYVAHTMQLFYLYQSGNLLVNTAALFHGKTLTPAQLQAFNTQLDITKKLSVNWMKYQLIQEDEGAPKLGLDITWFYSADGLKKIKAVLNKLSTEPVAGIGFIPLIIAGIIGLIALWGVYKISERFTTTVADKEELLNTTAKTAKDLGLTPAQASSLISQTQAEVSSGSSILPWLAGGGILAYFLFGRSHSQSPANN